ncbi:MAG: protein translocase subunit SecF [Clostridia bacterium]|nr:protein translocase subunit SecF [Clostridia bacterium]
MKISNLLEKDFHLVEKKKIFFLIPVAIVVVTAVFMLIYGLVLGSPVNLGMDFTGGYSIDITLGTKLTDENRAVYEKQINEIFADLSDENGESYGLKVSSIQRQGEAEKTSLHVLYNAAGDERLMDEVINPALQEKIQSAIFKIVPSASKETSGSGSKIVLSYNFSLAVDSTFTEVRKAIRASLGEENVDSIERSEDSRTLTVITNSAVSDETLTALVEAATIDDRFSGLVSPGNTTSASFSAELLWSALAAILASVVLMLVYIAFRFELTSGLSAIIALFHDILIMFCFMVIFRIEINSTFIAAMITILGYSINNTIIIFDRVRENNKSLYASGSTATFIANKSVSETLLRSINTSITTLLTIGMVAILGVHDIKIFALPIIIGLLAGTYSSICISPAIWASWKDRKKKNKTSEPKKELEKATAV